MTTPFAALAALIFLLGASGFAAPAAAVDPVSDDGNTMSLNTEVVVVPAPGPVTIDGATGDWDLSAGVWTYNDPTIVNKFSAWVHLMHDSQGVYFLARYYDATPLQNATRGKDIGNSWKNDCFQGRVVFDDRTPEEHQMHINLFYSTPEQTPMRYFSPAFLCDAAYTIKAGQSLTLRYRLIAHPGRWDSQRLRAEGERYASALPAPPSPGAKTSAWERVFGDMSSDRLFQRPSPPKQIPSKK